jgi:hypothetical protein
MHEYVAVNFVPFSKTLAPPNLSEYAVPRAWINDQDEESI